MQDVHMNNVVNMSDYQFNVLDFASYSQNDVNDAFGVIFDSKYEPDNKELIAFKMDSDLAKRFMNYIEEKDAGRGTE